MSVPRDQAAALCRSGEFPTCDRFRVAHPDWSPAAPARQADDVTETRRQLLTSAAWVIGIPTGITLAIILAIWVTENVWMPTQSVLFNLFR